MKAIYGIFLVLVLSSPLFSAPNIPGPGPTPIPTLPGPTPTPTLPGPTPTPTLPGPHGGGWDASCTSTHQALYGSQTVACPVGMCPDNATCGCGNCSGPGACYICNASTACPTGTSCQDPSGCQSLVCVGTIVTALSMTMSRFTTTGVAHDGAVICDVNPGTTSTNIEEKLKDETCRNIYRSLRKFQENYP